MSLKCYEISLNEILITSRDAHEEIMFGLVWFMVLNATFNNISVISWWSVLLVEETGVPGENHRPAASH